MLINKKNLGFFSKTVMLGNLLAIVGLLLSYSASFINPKSFWGIAFLGLGYLPILLINVGFILYWILRKPRFALLSLGAILLGWNLMTQHITFSEQVDLAPSDTSLRVMSFNAHMFSPIEGSEKPPKDEFIEIVNETKPDVLCVQEFYSTIKGNKRFSETVKNKADFDTYYFAPSTQNDYMAYGQAIFSKYPIINSGLIKKNEYGINRIIYADIVKNQDTIRVYNVHLRSFGLQNEDKEFIQNPGGAGGAEETATRRVGRKLKWAFEQRSNQAESLSEHMAETHLPKIIMGDFNDTPMSYSVNLIGKDMKNAFQEKGNGWGITHFEMLPILQIDYIFADKQFAVNNYHIIKKKLSDHYPIWADLSMHKGN
ncbi:endonuclease/exonuclease/phosphatase family protein [Sphingobacterium hotanense]|uniref:endonuclease/exonuclease/phosphatase family protein n=1 Tax=Sphingobacterium hotanense TaxID=649196 RepID=UPI0021A2C615|nr:endonuclease/exonuclease/phosphatase family protein [Sphingobacterium hotanense]MCT1526573.1 endonuclease/exonuclease/phosphatase family protein [Sphingobacterium hotanense]